MYVGTYIAFEEYFENLNKHIFIHMCGYFILLVPTVIYQTISAK
jgi:hypothetical protein